LRNDRDEGKRRGLFDSIEIVQRQNRSLPVERIDLAITQAIRDVRRARRGGRKRA
jgi:hypothetical protein